MGAWGIPELDNADQQEEQRSFWDWYRKNGDAAASAAGDAICLIAPNSPRCRPAYPPPGSPHYAGGQDNTLLYVMIGVILFLALLLILKK